MDEQRGMVLFSPVLCGSIPVCTYNSNNNNNDYYDNDKDQYNSFLLECHKIMINILFKYLSAFYKHKYTVLHSVF